MSDLPPPSPSGPTPSPGQPPFPQPAPDGQTPPPGGAGGQPPTLPPEPSGGGSGRRPLFVVLGIVAVVALVVGGLVVVSGGGDDDDASDRTDEPTSDPDGGDPAETTDSDDDEPTETTDPDDEPTDDTTEQTDESSTDTTSSDTTEPSGDEPDIDAAVANLQQFITNDTGECPVAIDALEAMSSTIGSEFFDKVLASGELEASGVMEAQASGASALVCSAESDKGAVGAFFGTLGDKKLAGWISESLGFELELDEASEEYGGEPAYTIDTKTDFGPFKGAAWTDGQLVVIVVGFTAGAKLDLDPASAAQALTESLDGIVIALAEADAATPDTTLPSSAPIDTSAAVRGVVVATRPGVDEAIECPVEAETMETFNDPIESAYVERALGESPIFGASVWLREQQGATALRCTAGGPGGLVGIYIGTLGGKDIDYWMTASGAAFKFKEVGANRGGTVYSVKDSFQATAAVGALWTDGNLVVLISAVGDSQGIDFKPAKAVEGLMVVLQGVVDDLAEAG